MAKYTEAYNDITNRNIDIMHVRIKCADCDMMMTAQ